MIEYYVLTGIICFVAGGIIAYWVKGVLASQQIRAAESEANRILEEARHKRDTMIKESELEAKDILFRMKSDFDAETKETRADLKKREKRLIQKEENIDRKMEQFEQRLDGGVHVLAFDVLAKHIELLGHQPAVRQRGMRRRIGRVERNGFLELLPRRRHVLRRAQLHALAAAVRESR